MRRKFILLLSLICVLCLCMFVVSACKNANPNDNGTNDNQQNSGNQNPNPNLAQLLCSHEYDYSNCVKCGVKKPSEGLEYELNAETDEYTVVGSGTCTDTVLVIPSTYNGKKVTAIGKYAFAFFWNDNYAYSSHSPVEFTGNLTQVIVHEGITSIDATFVYNCPLLEKISLPSTLTYFACKEVVNYEGIYVSHYPMDFNNNLVYPNLTFYEVDGLRYLGNENDKFIACVGITETTDTSVINVKEGCKFLHELTLYSSGVGILEVFADRVNLPSTLLYHTPYPYMRLDGGTDVYFAGTLEDWAKVLSGNANSRYPELNQSLYDLYINGSKVNDLVVDFPYVEQMAFQQINLNSITICSNVEYIGYGAFYASDNSYLSYVTILENSHIPVLKTHCFGYRIIDAINIPATVTKIEDMAFYACHAKEVNFGGTKAQWNAIQKGLRWKGFSAWFVNCTDGDVFLGEPEETYTGNGCGTPVDFNTLGNGKGNGQNSSVTDYTSLQTALNGYSTITMEYKDSFGLGLYTLEIPDFYWEGSYDYVPVYKADFTGRVEDLHTANTSSLIYGRLAHDFDYISFVDFDMKTGIAKIVYLNDSKTFSIGYCSLSELGFNVYEANQPIDIYADSTFSNKLLTTPIKDVLVVVESTPNYIKVKYSVGNGFKDGYIKTTADITPIRIMVFEDDSNSSAGLNVYDNKIVGNYAKDDNRFDGNLLEWVKANKEKLKLPTYSIFRYYGFQEEIYQYTSIQNGTETQRPINSATISFIDSADNQWKTGYVQGNDAYIVQAKLNKVDVLDRAEEGKIKVFNTENGVYIQIDAEYTAIRASSNILEYHYAINAEIFVNENQSFIKINSFDIDGENYANYRGIGFNGVRNDDLYRQYIGNLVCGCWKTFEELNFILDKEVALTSDFVSPFNIFLENHFNADGSLKMAKYLNQINKIDNQKTGNSEIMLELIGYENMFDIVSPVDKHSDLKVDINYGATEKTEIDMDYSINVEDANVFESPISNIDLSIDRTLTVENVDNTVIPSKVLQEINAIIN